MLVIAAGSLAPFAAAASEIVYRPVNPAFGGDPFNSAFLLETARAQKDGGDGPKIPDINFEGFDGPLIIIDDNGTVTGNDPTPPIPDNP